MPDRVSVVIATYNRDAMLIDTVQDVLSLDYPDYEIIVVDQTPNHDEKVAEQLQNWHQTGKIRWIALGQPGLTRARNVGWRESTGSYVVYVDDDVEILEPRFIQYHVKALSKPGIGAVAGRVLEPHAAPLVVPRRIGWLGYLGTREPGFGTDFSGPSWSVRGCNMSFHRTVLDKVGGFDERYTKSAFREDTDISRRVTRAGFKIWFAHEAWLYHLSASEGGTRDRTIPVDSDLILNDVRYAAFNLSGVHRMLWLARIYGSRVVKAGLKSGGFGARHQAFSEARTSVSSELRESR